MFSPALCCALMPVDTIRCDFSAPNPRVWSCLAPFSPPTTAGSLLTSACGGAALPQACFAVHLAVYLSLCLAVYQTSDWPLVSLSPHFMPYK